MSTQVYFDEKGRVFRTFDPDKMTRRERANWAALQEVLNSEYARGFARGLAVGRAENARADDLGLDISRPVL